MTQAELNALVNGLIIDNNTNQVTPAKVRSVFLAVIDSIQQTNLAGVTANAPLNYDAFNNLFTIFQSDSSKNGYLSSEDWNTFNDKQDLLTEVNFGAFVNTLSIKLTPSADDEIVTLDSITGEAVTIKYSDFGGGGGGGGVTQTKKTITSANLSTQDMTGFLTYVNGVTSFAIASNEIVEYLVTDTGQIFKLMVNNRSVGSGETALTSTDVLEIEFPQETILQNIGVWVKFNQASANAYPFAGGTLNSGSIQGSKTTNINEYSNSHITLNATNGVINSGARFTDGNSFPTTPFKGVTFFAVICPIVTTNLSSIIGMPVGSSLTTITENTNQGIWFNITGNQLQAKCAYASAVSTGTAVTITATEWLLCMIEVIDNNAVNKRVRFKVKKIDGTVVYNQDITTNIQPYNIFSGNSSTGCRAVLTSTAVGNTDILGLQAMGFWMNKPNFLRNF